MHWVNYQRGQEQTSHSINDKTKTGVGQGVGIITNENIIGKFEILVPGYLVKLKISGKKSCDIYNIYYTNTTTKFNAKCIRSCRKKNNSNQSMYETFQS